MAEAMTVTPRKIYMDDLAVTVNPTGDTATETVLGVGPTALTKIPLTLITQMVQAATDAAAGVAGAAIGDIYFNTATNKLRTRMT